MNVDELAHHLERVDISGRDVQAIAGEPINVVLYSSLGSYTLSSLLAPPLGAAIILYQTTAREVGHFTCLYRDRAGTIHFFDPYGFAPDAELPFAAFDRTLPHYLTMLLSGVSHSANSFDYQGKRGGVNTCGRWVGTRLRTRHIFSDSEFESLFTGTPEPTDFYVALMTVLFTLGQKL